MNHFIAAEKTCPLVHDYASLNYPVRRKENGNEKLENCEYKQNEEDEKDKTKPFYATLNLQSKPSPLYNVLIGPDSRLQPSPLYNVLEGPDPRLQPSPFYNVLEGPDPQSKPSPLYNVLEGPDPQSKAYPLYNVLEGPDP